MTTWQEFTASKPELAAIGKRLFMLGPESGGFEGGLAYLATIRKDGGPRIHPISPALSKVGCMPSSSSSHPSDMICREMDAMRSMRFRIPSKRTLLTTKSSVSPAERHSLRIPNSGSEWRKRPAMTPRAESSLS
jgi:hypothetical protein